MLKRNLIFTFIILQFTASLNAFGQREKNLETIHSVDINLEKHLELKEIWKDSNIQNYDFSVSFNAFSPMRGQWNIKVRNGELDSWEKNDVMNDPNDRSGAFMFLQENIYSRAEEAYASSGAYKVEAIYREDGFLLEVKRVKNRDFNGQVPTDMAYAIKISSIKLY